jgi:hypothetical protein
MRYVIRSMSTTDFEPYSHEPVRPYHIYLMRPELRGRAYWSNLGDAQRFDSYRKAEAEERRLFPEDDRRTANIVPEDDRAYPTYWEISNMNRAWKDTKAKAAAEEQASA